MTPLPTQETGAAFLAANRRALLADEPRVGKEQPIDCVVISPSGEVPIGNLKIGDVVCAPDGGQVLVGGVYPQGVKQAYRITFSDGAETECGADHLWLVRDGNFSRNGYQVRTLKSLFGAKRKLRIPITKPVSFYGRSVPLHPYLVGALIGDGSLCNGEVLLSIADRDKDILDRIKSLHPEISITERRTGANVCQVRLLKTISIIRDLGMGVRSHEKSIPVDYLINSIERRVALLCGLLDTDGYCSTSGEVSSIGIHRHAPQVSFSTKSKMLANNVTWLVRSLGGMAETKTYMRGDESEFRVPIQISFCPFLTAFKRQRWKAVQHPSAKRTRRIVKIEPSRMVEQVCIKVNSGDGLYLTNDFIVTHNTGAALLAADRIQARTIDIVTTASGRGVWRRSIPLWALGRGSIGVLGVDRDAAHKDIQIRSWAHAAKNPPKRKADLVILDEDHYATNPGAQRTIGVYGKMLAGGETMLTDHALVQPDQICWHLSGTPCPHDPSNWWARMRASCPERLTAQNGWPDVTRYDDFRERYCVIVMKKISAWTRIPVVIKGRRTDELAARLKGFYLRRTQADIGIRPPSYDLLPLIPTGPDRRAADGDLQRRLILEAAEAGDTKKLEMELGPLRRLTGVIKADLVVQAVREEFESGLDKIVLMYFHRDVGDVLEAGLSKFGTMRIDGSTLPARRGEAERRFLQEPECRVAITQIDAAGEAVDFSAASVLWFVETVFSPKSMAQAAFRITNINQKRNAFCRVCVLLGSIDEAVQASLLRLWTSIKETMA